MWIERLKLQPKNPLNEKAKYVNIIKNGMFDFYSESLYDFVDNDGRLPVHWHGFKKIPFDRLMNGRNFERFKRRCEALIGKEECQMLVLENLSFPHSNLKEVLDLYEELTGTFITTKVFELYQKTQKLYDKINENRDNHKKWFDCLLESKNDRFIIQNVESRISEEPTNIEMWQLYIKFLKRKNKKAAFEVYFRYKRLFLSDKTFDDDFKLWKGKITLQRENRYLDKMKYYISVVNGKQSLTLPAPPLYYHCRILPPQIIPKLKLGKIRILKIYSQIFSSENYEFLTKNKSIEKIVLYDVSIVNEDDGFIILEDLFKNLSNAVHIE
uniref:Uncharacterized protein n=1 Tax=Panagrolaimus sp. PS1159 TaxID=55785 RepID=A0AC35ES50_9BILA